MTGLPTERASPPDSSHCNHPRAVKSLSFLTIWGRETSTSVVSQSGISDGALGLCTLTDYAGV